MCSIPQDGLPTVTFVLGCHSNSEAGPGRLLFRMNLSIPLALECATIGGGDVRKGSNLIGPRDMTEHPGLGGDSNTL